MVDKMRALMLDLRMSLGGSDRRGERMAGVTRLQQHFEHHPFRPKGAGRPDLWLRLQSSRATCFKESTIWSGVLAVPNVEESVAPVHEARQDHRATPSPGRPGGWAVDHCAALRRSDGAGPEGVAVETW